MASQSIDKSSVLSPVNADVPGDASSTFELTVGAPIVGNVDFDYDQDWYRFETRVGATYVFDLEGSDTSAGTLEDPYLRLLDGAGNELAAHDGAYYGSEYSRNSQIGFLATADEQRHRHRLTLNPIREVIV
jgi:hypothetical protein